MPSLRDRLRAETGDAHRALDDVVGCFDVASRDRLWRFLSLHDRGMAAIAACAPPLPSHYDLAMHRALVTADLRALDTLATAHTPHPATFTQPLASSYILCGACLGAQILRERWSKASDAITKRAGTFLCHAAHPDGWRKCRTELTQINAASPLADNIVCDALAIFELYRAAALDLRDTEWGRNDR